MKKILEKKPVWPNSTIFLAVSGTNGDDLLTTESGTGLYLHAFPEVPIGFDGKLIDAKPADWLEWLKAGDYEARNKAHISAVDSCPDLPDVDQVQDLSIYDSVDIAYRDDIDTIVHNAELSGELDGVCLWLPHEQTGWIDYLYTIDSIIETVENYVDPYA